MEGRQAYRLVSGPITRPDRPKQTEHVEFFVDAETYLPPAQRLSIGTGSEPGFEIFTRYLIYKRLPLNARSRGLLALDPHPGAECSPFAGDASQRELGFPNPCATRR